MANLVVNLNASSNSIILPIIDRKEDAVAIRVSITARSALDKFSKAWTYAGKSFIVSRHLLNASLRSCRLFFLGCHYHLGITKTITKIKLLAVVSIPLNILSFPEQFSKITRSIKLRDHEGLFLSGIGLSVSAVDILDSFATFTNAFLQLVGQTAISGLAALGMPSTMAMLTQGSISRIVRLKNLNAFSDQLRVKVLALMKEAHDSPEEVRAILQGFVETHLATHLDDPQLKERHEVILERISNKRVVVLLQEVSEWLKSHHSINSDDLDHLNKTLEEVLRLVIKDKNIQQISLVVNFINILAMLSFYTPIPSVVPFLVLAAGFSLRIAIQAYQDFF